MKKISSKSGHKLNWWQRIEAHEARTTSRLERDTRQHQVASRRTKKRPPLTRSEAIRRTTWALGVLAALPLVWGGIALISTIAEPGHLDWSIIFAPYLLIAALLLLVWPLTLVALLVVVILIERRRFEQLAGVAVAAVIVCVVSGMVMAVSLLSR